VLVVPKIPPGLENIADIERQVVRSPRNCGDYLLNAGSAIANSRQIQALYAILRRKTGPVHCECATDDRDIPRCAND
jgi:hypothetical protein